MSLQNLFVAKLPRNISDADLLHIFSDFEPSSAKIMLDAATGKSKGFGFVLFDEEEKGAKAYKALNRKMTRACGHSFTLVIYPSNHNGKIFTEESNALYIRNIPISIGQEKMERFLRTFGNLIYFAMREDHYGNPVWVVYAEYETVDDAKNALAKLHGNNTYFHGSVPILAKFEDSDDAKKERRRRRDGMQTHAPNSGCIFPPPHSHHENSGSLHTASTTLSSESIVSSGHGGSSNRTVESKTSSKSTAGPRRSGTGGIAAAVPLLTPASAPPPFLPAMTDVAQNTPTAAFSMPQQLLQSTPGYFYTLGESGQQIFVPASSFSSSMPPYNFAPATQSAPLLLLNPPMQTTDAVAKPNFSLLNPAANATVVLMENGLHYMLTPEAMNINCEPFSSPTSAYGPMLAGSQPKSLLGMSSSQATYTNGSACSINSFGPCLDALYTDPLHVVPLRCDAEDEVLGEASIAGPNTEDTARVHALQRASTEGSVITGQRGLGVGW
ncbi:putative RNA-binding protein [Leishmania major strain Friedlin]|uniref:Putative RNA-binding protein n=1 Tax=Leishmania major TaxID=5664 RepID=Q4Q774_LEIMA|nr:putative RNA-binding protein [Leishmania major strain Friedlin]CAG9578454.1 RNA-binding_protein_-_putative [Leishmania major strain Friedlin]CAJ06458.1 putative RNA-binding protein [Leishmania major strain Friedlin]|eukprot:XP_001684824.1 putative RNA-binding protein [Leishmania major strain Friedlin]